MDDPLIAALKAKIADLQSMLTQAAATGYLWNEAQTESAVIDPLLSVLGYGPLEYYKQGHDAVTKGIPDYTLLPNSQHKWFLEAKKLDLPLKDGEAFQAVSYAVAQGAEWAVLTNGRAWYFYNAHYPKPLAEKRMFQIHDLFNEPEAIVLLSRLSRPSMLNKGLTQAWVASRIADVVRQQLQTPNSAARKALRKAASEELQTSVGDDLIGRVLGQTVFPKVDAAQPEVIPVGVPDDLPPDDDLHTLEYLEAHPELVTGRKPTVMKLFEEAPKPIKSWSVLVQKTVAAVAARYGLPPLPFVGSTQGEKYFLNTSPVRADGKPMITVVQIPVNGSVVYADMNRSAINTVQGLLLLLESVGAPIHLVRLKTDVPEPSSE